MTGAQKIVVLDRDGVINVDSPEYIKSAEEFVPLQGSIDAIARLSRAGFCVVIASNQSGIGRGLLSHRALIDIHAKLLRLVDAAGGAVTGIYVCPHDPSAECDCRKPKTGLLRRLSQDLGVSLIGAPIIGDSQRDLDAAIAVRARPILVRTGNGETTLSNLDDDRPVEVFRDLAAAADQLVMECA